jgi:hypothetical protein
MRSRDCVFALSLLIPINAFAQDPAASAPMAPPAAPAGSATSDPVAATAVASPAPSTLSREGWSTKIVDRPIALSAGMLEADVPVATNMSKAQVGKPINTPLSIYYGVTDQFQLSLHHNRGLCMTGEENGCAKAYNDLGLRATASLLGRGSSFELAAWAQLHFVSFSPDTVMQAQIGPYFNWVIAGGNALILSNPALLIGLNNRDGDPATMTPGNKEALAVPVYGFFQATDNLAPYLVAGIGGPLDGFGDSYAAPVGVGVFAGVNNRIDIIGEFQFTNLLGKVGDAGRADGRQLLVQLNYRPL